VSETWTIVRRYGLGLLVVLAALEAALEVAFRDDPVAAPRTSHWFAVPAVALIVLPLLAYRRFPLAAPVSVLVAGAALSFVDGRLVVFPAGVLVMGMAAALLVGTLPDVHRARLGLAVLLAGATVIVSNDPRRTTGEFISIPVLLAVGWFAGRTLRERGEQARDAEVRAARAERERETAARIGVAEERARIARELHDIVAHSVSVMVLQVGAVRHKLPPSLAEETEALKDVEATGRTALVEMRRLLGAMREDGDGPEMAPQPGLGSLDALFAQVRRAGLPVELRVDGEPRRLPPAIDLSAYRIVQEGLTNALKHAGASRADVEVRYGAHEVRIEVRDDGRGPAGGDGLGHGLVGIGERVKLYGGEMDAGRANGGGFVLRTRLPVEGGAR
jgi:signal transduction histidine kinase